MLDWGNMSTKTKLYDGAVTILFDNKARNRYLIEGDGRSPVGVTTILSKTLAKEALMTWPLNEALKFIKTNCEVDGGIYQLTTKGLEEASKAYLRKSDTGKSTGTAIHASIEALLTNKSFTTPPEAEKGVKSFVKWFNEHSISPMAVEQIVYSKKYDFCGTYDSMLDIDGKVTLVDIKSTNSSRSAPRGIYAEHFLQLGAYSLAHHEENPLERIERLMIVRVGKDGVLNTMTNDELGLSIEKCEKTFLSVLEAYRFMTPLAKEIQGMK